MGIPHRDLCPLSPIVAEEGYQDDEVDGEVPPAHLWHNRGRTSKPLPLRKNMFGV